MNQELTCDHCQSVVYNDFPQKYDGVLKHFCCLGCKSVYNVLYDSGLTQYYKYQSDKIRQKVVVIDDKYEYLDDISFWKNYVLSTNDHFKFTFFIEGIHCSACLWLLEKLPEFIPNLIKSRVNMSDSTLELEFSRDCKLSDIAKKIASFGYVAHPVTEDKDSKTLFKIEERKTLIRIGIAFACMGNIMLYSLSNYAGAEGTYKLLFNLYILLCFLPVIFYCAIPFYKSSLSSLKLKRFSIDLPISVALILGTIVGVYAFIYESDTIYFDTLSTLVFLLLLIRYLLKRIQVLSMGFHDFKSLMVGRKAIKVLENGTHKEVLSNFLNVGEQVYIGANEVIPIDGKIVKLDAEFAKINNSLITGESQAQKVTLGQDVFCGAKNLNQPFFIEVKCKLEDSRIGKILENIQLGQSQNTIISRLAEKLAQRFVMLISILSVSFFVYFYYYFGFQIALMRTITLLVITCPCALALTTPLALYMGISLLARKGIFVKNENVIESLASSKKIFLDKTGTLTNGDFQVCEFLNLKNEDIYVSILYALELHSDHPIASAIKNYIKLNLNPIDITLEQVEEIIGLGVKARFNNKKYFVGKSKSFHKETTNVALYEEDEKVLEIKLSDQLRVGVYEVIKQLKKNDITPYIVSGDNKSVVKNVANNLQISSDNIYFEQSPETKLQLIEQSPKTIMVGDGVNDAMALQKAYVGIAVGGSADISMKAASVHMKVKGVDSVYKLILVSKKIIQNIKLNLFISLAYNIVGVYLTFIGVISPLIAAVLMPLSSITVLISTIINLNLVKKDI